MDKELQDAMEALYKDAVEATNELNAKRHEADVYPVGQLLLCYGGRSDLLGAWADFANMNPERF